MGEPQALELRPCRLSMAELLGVLRHIYARSCNTYGVPRLDGEFRKRGWRVARSIEARLMRANGLVGANAPERRRSGRPDAGDATDLLNRLYQADASNKRLFADANESPNGDSKLHLAGLQDLFHRRIVGWDTSPRQDTVLVAVLQMALTRTGNPAEAIHHADKCSICRLLDFEFAAGNADMHLSFDSTGDDHGKAAMKTFWARSEVEPAWIRG